MHRPDEPLFISSCQELFELELSDRFMPVALVQGGYYFVTGIWPLISIASFQFVTGPKVDLWLVKTVGVLVAVIGVGLLVAAYRRRATLEISLIALGSALGLIAIDVSYVLLAVIPPIYLLDAVVELALVAWWGVLWRRHALAPSPRVADPPQTYGDIVGHSYTRGDGGRSGGGEP
jgi:hypothetical protein